jgi:hypothetical protein
MCFNKSHLRLLTILLLLPGCHEDTRQAGDSEAALTTGPVYVTPDDDLQKALDQAAGLSKNRTLILRPGRYQSASPKFCLLAVTARHNGVVIAGEKGVVLSGRNALDAEVATVAHVIYCGDGVDNTTVIKDLRIEGGMGVSTNVSVPVENFGERARVLKQGLFFLMDGGAVKVFGKSSPVFERIEFVGNETTLCGGAVSIEHQGVCDSPVLFRHCEFRNNRCPATGSAIDVLQGSTAEIENCLFVGNIANYGMDEVKRQYQLSYKPVHGSGALTVFPTSTAKVIRCTFANNWNGVDDAGQNSQYERCIFCNNDAGDGSRPGQPYEIDIVDADGVRGCVFHSNHPDLLGTVNQNKNVMNAADPEFDEVFVPHNSEYENAGYRP